MPPSKKNRRPALEFRERTNLPQKKSKVGENASGKQKAEWRHRAHLITNIGLYLYKVKVGDEDGIEETIYNLEKLESMFPTFAAIARRLAAEEEQEPEGFIACSVYSLVEKEYSEKRHQVYRRLAYQANYSTCNGLPEWLKEGIQHEWSYPGEIYVDHKDPHERGR